jgi:hypothetical protein
MNWAKKMITKNARNIQGTSFLDFWAYGSFWAYGHNPVWAPSNLSIALMYFVMRFLLSPPYDKKESPYVPKRCRKLSRIVCSTVKSIWDYMKDLIMRELAKSQTCPLVVSYVNVWWRRPRNKRRLWRLRTGCNSQRHGSRRHRMARRKKHSCSYRKWDFYSRDRRYFDAEEDHFCDVHQFDRSDYPYYFKAAQFETECEVYEFTDAIPFREDDLAPGYKKDTSDCYWIAVDNCSSRCITNCLSDFITPPTPVDVSVRSIGGCVTASFIGTVK